MTQKEWLGDREHALEEEYFWRKEHELVARLREESRRAQARRALGNQLGHAGEPLVRSLQDAGFTDANLGLLHVVPLVEVAWADGAVSAPERHRILAMAAQHGIQPNTQSGAQLTAWLDERPDEHLFDMAVAAIRFLLHQEKDQDTRTSVANDLVQCCTKVAQATGETLGLVRVSHNERDCLARLRQALTEGANPH